MIAAEARDRLAIAEAMVSELDDYLDGDKLFRQLVVQAPGGTHKPNMTLGLLLDYMAALERDAASMWPADRIRFEEAAEKLSRIRHLRRDRYADRVRRELISLLGSWEWFIDGCEKGDGDCADDYPAEVWIRTRIADLLNEARGIELNTSEEEERRADLDRRLDEMFSPGAYIGPTGLEADRPSDTYWWLYGRPVAAA